jgi:hypothetical protein
VSSLANHDVRFEAVLRDIDGEITSGVACADDQNPVSFEIVDVVVLAGVQLPAGELARNGQTVSGSDPPPGAATDPAVP